MGFVLALACRKEKPVVLEGDDTVLAEVNGHPISRYDLDRALSQTLGNLGIAELDPEAGRRVIEGLIMERAIAQAEEEELSARDQAAVAREVEAHRQQILVKRYLERHSLLEAVTRERVEAYYGAHLEQFGAKQVRRYELFSTERPLSGAERQKLLTALSDAGTHADWEAWSQGLRDQGLPVAFLRGDSASLLHPELRRVIRETGVGQVAPVIFLSERAYLVRVIADEQREARPLTEVSAEIYRALRPVQYRDAVKKAADRVMSEARVVRHPLDGQVAIPIPSATPVPWTSPDTSGKPRESSRPTVMSKPTPSGQREPQ